MAWFQSSNRKVQLPAQAQTPPVLDKDERIAKDDADAESLKRAPTDSNVTEDQNRDPFMGVKVRRKASFHRNYIGDYLDVPSRPYLMKILEKQGDKKVLFADKVLKFTSTGKMKRRIFLVTDFAVYIVDPNIDALKRRISLAAVEKLCLSELSDNFLAIIIPTEYDLLIASTRKTEIVSVLVDATRSQSDYELEVLLSNRFEYNATSELVKEIDFEETEVGRYLLIPEGARTRIVRKGVAPLV
ncbi:uncharacterized protein [Solanum lycopersicum]|uniref:uncharacterized protein isoform X1 n=1 Tax=Solanum lycopersicum TaxID=4081 RepID=UPI000E1CC0D6|nr:myosin IB heavy chain isoform X1 [Solanum lycopersicum]XP_025887275.1 myosin IB heavy chain isoform X1 [Solanum lycopersicum]